MDEQDTRVRMSDEQLVVLFKRCHKYALRNKCTEDTAQDFSSWAIVAVLDGHHPKLAWLFASYFRSLFGRKESKHNAIRREIYGGVSLDDTVSQHSDTLRHEIIADGRIEEREEQEPDPNIERVRNLAVVGQPRDVQEIVGYLSAGWSQTEIATFYGKSDFWVSWKLQRYRLALAQVVVSELKKRAPQSVDVDTRLEVNWVNIP